MILDVYKIVFRLIKPLYINAERKQRKWKEREQTIVIKIWNLI